MTPSQSLTAKDYSLFHAQTPVSLLNLLVTLSRSLLIEIHLMIVLLEKLNNTLRTMVADFST